MSERSAFETTSAAELRRSLIEDLLITHLQQQSEDDIDDAEIVAQHPDLMPELGELCWSTDFCTPVEWPHWPSIPPNAGIRNNRPEAPQLSGLNTRGIGWRLLTARFSGPLSCVGLNHRPQFGRFLRAGGCIARCA